MNRKLTKKDKEANRYLKQISVLRQRLTLNRATSNTGTLLHLYVIIVAMYFAFAEHWYDIWYSVYG